MASNTQSNLPVDCGRHLLIVNNGQETDLILNEYAQIGNALLIRTVGSVSSRDCIGREPTLFMGDTVVVRHVKADSGDRAQSVLRVHFGLGGALGAERLEIARPNGGTEVVNDLAANQIVTIVEGEGITDRVTFNQ